MIGQRLSHYELLEKLGEGGMGVVYRALDVRLNRPVAIKVLPHDALADAHRARRFMQEARAASALNHPHIITVHEVDADGGTDFIVMEYVTGSTLEQLIGHQALTLDQALKYAAQIADALAAAHRAGIVHRDLKPGNVMITERGDAKVLDFGLAKLSEPSDADVHGATTRVGAVARTEAGTILGTVGYMSPEQAEGKNVDARSDVFSFGSLLYEMVTGLRAFRGETKLSTLSAILQREPTPASAIVNGVPPELDHLIANCLRKDPERRFQHLEDVKALIEGLRDGSATKVERALPGARATMRPRLLAAVLVVLVTTAAGAAWWLTRDRDRGSAAATPGSRLSTGGPASTNAEANRLFEAAMLATMINYDIPRAQQLLDRALETDPRFAEARAWRAFTNFLILDAGYSNDSALLTQAEEGMRRALQDDPTLVRAHTGMAALYVMQGRRELVLEELDLARNADPNDVDELFFRMQYHHHAGDYALAQPLGQRILDRMPLFSPARFILGYMLQQQGDLTGAMREYERVLEQEPQFPVVLGLLARTYQGSGDLDKARQYLERASPADRKTYYLRLVSATLLAGEGRREQAIAEVDDEVLKYGALVSYVHTEVAAFYAVLGDAPKALEWLELAVRHGDERAEWFGRDPLLVSIRNHPRFQQILESIEYRRQQRKK